MAACFLFGKREADVRKSVESGDETWYNKSGFVGITMKGRSAMFRALLM